MFPTVMPERIEQNLVILKDILGFNVLQSDKDMTLEHYLYKAEKSIQNYLNHDDDEFMEIVDKFSTQIIDLAKYYYLNKSNTGVIQQSQGSRSMTIERGIPLEIKDSLPYPKIRVIG